MSKYGGQNLVAARVILESPEKYAGLTLEWARAVVDAEELRQAAGRRLQARENAARAEE